MSVNMKTLVKELGGTRKDILTLPVEALFINPKFDERKSLGDIDELAQSIANEGYHPNEPIYVRPSKDGSSFEVADGRRRARASKLAKEKYGWTGMVYATPAPASMTDQELIFATLYSNNDRRKPFAPLEEGRYFLMLKIEMGVKEEEIGKRIGKSVTYIQDRISFATLDDSTSKEISAYIESGILSVTSATKIAKISDKDERAKVWYDIKKSHLEAVHNKTEKVSEKKIKVSDVVKAKKGQTEHLSIKNVKANLEKSREMYAETKDAYWLGAMTAIQSILNDELMVE